MLAWGYSPRSYIFDIASAQTRYKVEGIHYGKLISDLASGRDRTANGGALNAGFFLTLRSDIFTMEEQVNRLVQKVWKNYEEAPASKRILIAISGIPGSGKTTLASLIIKKLNARNSTLKPGVGSSTPVAAFVPMDGYHLTRAQLSAMPDPSNAHARRGAAFTFDGSAFLTLVQKLREPLLPESSTIYAPSFDHKIKDPVKDDIPIHPTMRIIIFEGNYLSLNKTPWNEAASLMDELWFVKVDESVAKRRLIERHVRTGVTENEEAAAKRAEESDLLNGKEIIEGGLEVSEIVISREDEGWKPEKQGV